MAEVKKFLDLEYVRVATAERHATGKPVKKVAVCPGAGGSLFSSVRFTDLLVTGEMRHHDVQSTLAANTSVILTDHTNTERGYLPILAQRLSENLDIKTIVSTVDADPAGGLTNHDPSTIKTKTPSKKKDRISGPF